MADRVMEVLDESECLSLISPGGVGRIAYSGWFGLAVLPVNYTVQDGAVVFRTAEHGPLDEDLRTGIANADLMVAFEIDNISMAERRGWSVLIQGPAHHVAPDEEDAVREIGIESWAPGDRDLFVRIVPSRITGRRVGPA
jgi:nitroimidazol reductase NimA-like FMN-containing flavoprotein (pyridoxamine 5'-phosphate oxidase superfamily)